MTLKAGLRKAPLADVVLSYWQGIAGNIITDACANVAYALIPALTGVLVDDVLLHRRRSLWSVAALYLVLLAVGIVLEVCAQIIMWGVSTRFERAGKQRYFQAFLAEDPHHAAETTGGATLSRVTNNVAKLEQDYLVPAIALIKDSISIVIYAIVLTAVTDVWFAALMIGASLVALFLPRFQRRRLAGTAGTYMDTLAGYTSRAEELLASRAELPSAAQRAIALTHWRAAGAVRGDRYRYGFAKSLADGISGTGTELVLLVAFVASGWACLTGHMTVGAVAATLGYAKAFISPLTDMLYSINAIHSTDSIRADFNTTVQAAEDMPAPAPPAPVEHLQARQLPLRPDGSGDGVAPHIDLDISAAGRVLLLGHSGSGKTTLLRSVFLAHPDDHRFQINGEPMAQGRDLRDSIAYLGAASPVYHVSFHDNVTLFGAWPWDEPRVEALSGDTGFYERLRSRQDMTTASGGERQFTLLARALLQHPDVILLDEALSAIDQRAGRQILANLMATPAAVVLVTHNPGTLDPAEWHTTIDLDLQAPAAT